MNVVDDVVDNDVTGCYDNRCVELFKIAAPITYTVITQCRYYVITTCITTQELKCYI